MSPVGEWKRARDEVDVSQEEGAARAAAGERIGQIANRLGCDRTTVWRVCQRYREGGVRSILADEPRSGHPPEISPPSARPDRRAGVPVTARQGVAHHPLV